MGSWFTDPGPCPVDDTPHTACTPESVGARGYPSKVDPTVRVPIEPPLTFSTATYRRAVHGPAALAARASRPRASSSTPAAPCAPAAAPAPAPRAARLGAPVAPRAARGRAKGKP